MDDQAPSGWYPDREGSIRYWDGQRWTEHVQPPGGANHATNSVTPAKKEGAFAKLKKAATDKQAVKRAEKEELARKQAEDAQAAGALVTSGVFGTSTVEIYGGGYARVAAGQGDATSPSRITKDTQYEKLRSIKFTGRGQEKSAGNSETSGLMKGATDLMRGAGIMKGGAGLLKGSVPGLVAAGLSQMATAEAGKSFLTIVTDKQIHTLTNQSHNGVMKTSNRGHNEVGLALEAAGNSVLSGHGGETHEPVSEPRAVAVQPVAVSQAAAGPTLSERLRELSDLHKDGILSDEEFAAAKAKLLGGL